ncbi:MAG: ABC transporter permease [Microbacteriaceae bacterium]
MPPIVNRLLQAVITVVGATFVIFAAVFVLPGDAVDALVGDNPVTPAVEAALRERFNLDGSLWQQYAAYIGSVLSGDFGTTTTGRDVGRTLQLAWPITVVLALTAWAMETVLGLGLGIASALRPRGIVSRAGWLLTIVSLAVPTFAVALVLQHYVALQTGLFPVAGTRDGWPLSYLLPALTLALVGFGTTARLTANSVAVVRDSEFVRLARARGVPRRTIIGSYILKPGLIPLVTQMGLSLAGMLSGAVVVEAIFNLGGVGSILVAAVNQREGTVVVGVVTILVAIVAAINIVVDVIYRLLDPRLRAS